jgi:soluble lytic murein transglycosylase
VLGDYTLYFQARAAAGGGWTADAEHALGQLLALHPGSVWTGPAHLLAGKLRRASGDLAGARRALVAARAALPRGGDGWARATVALARVEYEADDPVAALTLVHEVRLAAPGRPMARRARRLADRIRRARPDLVPWTAVEEADMSLREGDAARALGAAETALAAEPDRSVRARALWIRARAERALGEGSVAQATCIALARQMPEDPLAPGALLAAASWRWNADNDGDARGLFREVAARFPTSPQAAEALYALGRIDQEAGRYAAALASYRRLVERFPRSRLATEARWREGWIRYLAGELTRAARSFRALGEIGPPDIRPAAEYWEARALARVGRQGEARRRYARLAEAYPTSYYAGLAEERLGRPPPPGPAAVEPIPVLFPADLTGPHAERARLLAGLGFPRFARLEVDGLRDEGAARDRVLEAYASIGAPGPALRLASAMPSGTPTQRMHLYPLGYWEDVTEAAAARGLDPLLVVALIRQESLFDPEAVSPANAYGLMQLLPTTAREVAATTGAPAPDQEALSDPRTNIGLGATLLARLLDRHDGAVFKALAGYNAGDDAVAKWEHRYGSRPSDEFVELISYRETRHYVKAVLGNYRAYRQLYAPSPSATSAGSPPKAPLDMMTMTSPGLAEPTR